MEGNLNAAWIGLCGVIVGALAGFGGTYLKMVRDAKLEKKKIFREKLEELHIEIDNEINSIGKFSNKLALKIEKNWEFKLPNDFAKASVGKIEMLVNMYAPGKRKEFERFLKNWVAHKERLINDVLKITVAGKFELKEDIKEDELQNWASVYSLSFDSLATAAKELKIAIVDEHKKYI